ncbi:type I methionyl aminopeptidase [Candidatus Saccharibacteria bacterium]|nr:type I methionyl aminopeptidase [Candidatus Saccharibacteria bacterium]MCA9328298.1 type I methionyl aminopeptidase [Candidatus Saccharibacteria bacterium]
MRPKNPQEIENIRESGRILATVLELIGKKLRAGMTGKDIDELAAAELKKLGGKPVFKGVPGGRGVQDFPSIICISVDDAVVHGIPDSVPFKEGQLIGFDFGVEFGGMITDAARTYVVGGEYRTKREQELVEQTKHSLDAGIGVVKAGARTGDIAAAVQSVLDRHNLGIVRELVGHGVGDDLHEPPEIPNYGYKGTGALLKEGMTIAIEPMATLGEWRVVVDPDGWTIRTRDGSLSAHFEDTILVTCNGAEILTRL